MKLSIREDSEMQAITKALVWARGSSNWHDYCTSMDHSLVANMAAATDLISWSTGPKRRESKPTEITHSQDCFASKYGDKR